MLRIIAIASQKGGVGKTTTVVNLGVALAARHRKVLVVDLDPQECLTVSLGLESPEPGKSLAEVLLQKTEPAAILIESNGLTLAPAGVDLAEAEALLYLEMERERRLRRALVSVGRRFDYVLIDCPPSLGILTLNALAAASEVLIPVQTEFLALRRLGATLRTVERVRSSGLNRRLRVIGILPTLYDGRTVMARDVVAQLGERLGKDFRILDPIPRTVRLGEAPVAGRAIFDTAADSDGASAYRELAKEIDS